MVTERILTEYTADTRSFDRGARRYASTLTAQERMVNQRLDRIDARWDRSQRAIGMVTTALAGLASAAALVEFRNLAEGWRGVERSLASIGQTGGDAQQAMVDLAMRTRSEIGSTTAAVARMAKATGDDFETTMRRVETLQKMMATGGASSAEVSSVGLQLGQALQSGVLSGDEFASIREAAPVEFLDALAKAAGVTRAELRKVAEDQMLTSDIVLQALDGMAAQADDSFSKMAVSGQEAMTVLRTGLTAYVGQLDQSLGATEAVNGAMQWLGEYMAGAGEGAQTLAASLNIVAGAAVSLAGGRGIGAVTSAFRDAAAARRDAVSAAQAEVAAAQREIAIAEERVVKAAMHTRAMQEAGRATSTVERAQRSQAKAVDNLTAAQVRGTAASGALTAAQARLSLATRVSTGAMRAFNGVMAFFGGPVGVAITLAGALAVAIGQIPTQAERMASSLDAAKAAASEFESAMAQVRQADQDIAAAKNDMSAASARYKAAVAAEADVAVATAQTEINAINARIEGLERLRTAQLNAARVAALDAQDALTTATGAIRSQVAQKAGLALGVRGRDGRGDYDARAAAQTARVDEAVQAEVRDINTRLAAGDPTLTAEERAVASAAAEVERMQAQVAIMNEDLQRAAVGTLEAIKAPTEGVGTALNTVADGGDKASKGVKKLDDATKKLGDTSEAAGAQLANTFAQAALQARNLEDGIKQVLVQLLQMNGVDAFKALFSGSGWGGFFGTLFTGATATPTAVPTVASANGNIMTGRGPVRLNRYAAGGIARTPQLSLFGEGSMPEAYVPLPDGRTIPVTLRMPGLPGNPSSGQASGGISVQITNQIEAPAGTSDADLAALERRMAAIGRAQADALVARLKREGAL
ncbi:tape measure protein [Mangrovicoccus sp. HB161399]|uniref:tape measure protein n=1 Tax=Mangrovicoccus sp. HB161399 TaxID=2720392 RepID=UPI00155167B7|nr:tape measure protein [Mangrovicoccus sp. HB161399]